LHRERNGKKSGGGMELKATGEMVQIERTLQSAMASLKIQYVLEYKAHMSY
jgi:hypothetical protein